MTRLASFLKWIIGKLPRPGHTSPDSAIRHADSESVPLTVLVHDLRNLLNVINTSAAIMHDRLPAGVADEAFDDVRQSVTRASDLTREFLKADQPPSSARQQVDLNRVITVAVGTLTRLEGDAIRVRLELSSEPVMVLADVADIERILLNLALNARDAMPEGGVLTIETAVTAESAAAGESGARPALRARLRVCDTGSGMTPDVKGRMFEPYFTTKQGGLGLGSTSIALSVVRLGGTLSVDSEPNGGTCVTLHFPLAVIPPPTVTGP